MEYMIIALELLFGIIFALIWGFITASVRERKGYGRSWFWLGFFFGAVPVIIACLMPEKVWSETEETVLLKNDVPEEPEQSLFADEDYVQRTVSGGGWQCSCGRANPAYASTCACGQNKRNNDPSGSEYAARVSEREAKRQATASELRKYKVMLDAQLISLEEYNARVRELRRFL